MILGEKDFSDEQNEWFGELGILYLFSVSGMHIYVFLLLVKKVFFFLSLPKRTQDMLTLLILIGFLYLNGLSFGVSRIFLMFIFKWLNDKYDLEMTRLDGIQIVFFLMILVFFLKYHHLV
jgi:competence protein ComEC